LERYDGLLNVIIKFFPLQNALISNQKRSVVLRKSQSMLHEKVQELFPATQDIFLNYIHPDLSFSSTDRNMELDIYIPSLSLAIEYQGMQHFQPVGYVYSTKDEIQERDKDKKRGCEKFGITLIEVPYWWDNSSNSLASIIRNSRPDLLLNFDTKKTGSVFSKSLPTASHLLDTHTKN